MMQNTSTHYNVQSWSIGPNIAFAKPANQGPDTYSGHSGLLRMIAGNAVDGNTSNVNDGRCSHTTQGNMSQPAWWQVDLNGVYRITGVKIFNRERTCEFNTVLHTF